MAKSDVSSAVADSGIGRATHGFRWQACDVEAAWRAAVDAGVRTSSAYTSWRQPRHAPSAHTITRFYGSWPAALQAAGQAYGPVDPPRVVIRRALQTLWQRDGRPPTATAWRTWTERPVALTTVVHHYDSWRAAQAAAARPDLPLPPLSWPPWAQRFLALDVATLSGEEHAIRVPCWPMAASAERLAPCFGAPAAFRPGCDGLAATRPPRLPLLPKPTSGTPCNGPCGTRDRPSLRCTAGKRPASIPV